MLESHWTGGARVGWVNATWPFAELDVEDGRLSLRATFIGRFEFAPSDVIAVEDFVSVPVLASGVRIVHNRADVPGTVIFWSGFARPSSIAAAIRARGFGDGSVPAATRRAEGMPFRWPFVIAVVAIWNALLLSDRGFRDTMAGTATPRFGAHEVIALAFVFSTAAAVHFSPRLGSRVLAEGHTRGEVAPLLRLVMFVSGAMMLGAVAFARAM